MSLLREAAKVLAQSCVSDESNELVIVSEDKVDVKIILDASIADHQVKAPSGLYVERSREQTSSLTEAKRNLRNLFATYRHSNRATSNGPPPKRPCRPRKSNAKKL